MSSDSKSPHARFEIPGYVTADLDDTMIGDFAGRSIGDENSVEQHDLPPQVGSHRSFPLGESVGAQINLR
jgi:hypothetical protein